MSMTTSSFADPAFEIFASHLKGLRFPIANRTVWDGFWVWNIAKWASVPGAKGLKTLSSNQEEAKKDGVTYRLRAL